MENLNLATRKEYTAKELKLSAVENIKELEKVLNTLESRVGKGDVDICSNAGFLFTKPYIETESERKSKIENQKAKISELKEYYNI